MENISPAQRIWGEHFPQEIFDYMKFILYGTNDKDVIQQKDKALRELFAGMKEMGKRNLDKSLSLIKDSLDIFAQTKDELSEAFAQFFMGEVYQLKDDVANALDYYEKAYEVFQKNKNLMALNVEQKIKDLRKSL
jgi:tetratricopeptide (TPR) repeat protein